MKYGLIHLVLLKDKNGEIHSCKDGFYPLTFERLQQLLIDEIDPLLDDNKQPCEPTMDMVKAIRLYNNEEGWPEKILEYYKNRYEFYKTIMDKMLSINWFNGDYPQHIVTFYPNKKACYLCFDTDVAYEEFVIEKIDYEIVTDFSIEDDNDVDLPSELESESESESEVDNGSRHTSENVSVL